MKCYYDVLGVPRDSNEDDIKKAFRRLALQWHPDKNPDNVDEAKVQFQLLQQAYEVLSDSNERSWYDKHRESILRGGVGNTYEDKSLDVFHYFTSSCYSGYCDDGKGFYSVYREVFNIISAEDSEFNSDLDSDYEIPSFGKSDSLFDEVVQPFYSYWESYSTKKSYAWLNTYDIKEAQNRKVVRLMEKENKKIRDKARKTRNEEIRTLVKFVKKRDKRVKAHNIFLKEKRDINLKKAEDKRIMKLKEREEELASHQESDWSKFSNLEKDLRDIEANLTAEFGDSTDSETSLKSENSDAGEKTFKDEPLYCVACNKIFKTAKAFQNHENSKKHKDNVILLKTELASSEDEFKSELASSEDELKSELASSEDELKSECMSIENNSLDEGLKLGADLSEKGDSEIDLTYARSDSMSNEIPAVSSNGFVIDEANVEDTLKHTKTNKPKDARLFLLDQHEDDHSQDTTEIYGCSKRQKKKVLQQNILLQDIKKSNDDLISGESEHLHSQEASSSSESHINSNKCRSKYRFNGKQNKSKCKEDVKAVSKTMENHLELKGPNQLYDVKIGQSALSCITCCSTYPSKNKLFDHLKKSGHAVYVEDKHDKRKKTKKTQK